MNKINNFEMVELPNDNWGFHLKDENITVRIDKISFVENENDNETCTLKVKYVIIESEKEVIEEILNKQIGDLVISLLEDKIELSEFKKQFEEKRNNNNNNGNNN